MIWLATSFLKVSKLGYDLADNRGIVGSSLSECQRGTLFHPQSWLAKFLCPRSCVQLASIEWRVHGPVSIYLQLGGRVHGPVSSISGVAVSIVLCPASISWVAVSIVLCPASISGRVFLNSPK
ncbi:hypothetical protein PoB_002695900 [Plakobranchus ocellatus]|uniref:Uncharacterized protein n=1 Tax=Plakobranchus ocellatus TaxID=259542 RepID=A0AAV3ZYP8_9GAST|nr:hypothetical protein PoB_002695900 [Plakobranchus ocellatus]